MKSLFLLLSIPGFFINLFSNKHFIILFQNHYEIRPSGGFMGSYADVKFGNRKIESYEINDIYVPDGQLKGHVEPPAPIQEAFKTGEYKLRDANWKIDFTDSAREIEWFFNKGGVTEIDGIIAVNFGLLEKIIDIIGPIKPLDYQETVDKNNLYITIQKYSQNDSFPGSFQKKTYLTGLGDSLLDRIVNSSPIVKLRLANLIFQELNNNQIIIWVKDQDGQDKLKEFGWDGGLSEYKLDYFYPVESNLGVNKVNYFVDRSIEHEITTGIPITSKIKILFNNKFNGQNEWGGDYLNYQRIVIPALAEQIQVKINRVEINPDIDKSDKFLTLGFFVKVPVNSVGEVELMYNLPNSNNLDYNLLIKRQPGIYKVPYKLTLNGKIKYDDDLINDKEF